MSNLGTTTTVTSAQITTQGAGADGVHTTDIDADNPTLTLSPGRPVATTVNGGTIQVNGAGSSGIYLSNSTGAPSGLASMTLSGALKIQNTNSSSYGVRLVGDNSVVDGSSLSGATITSGGTAARMESGLGQSLKLGASTLSNTSGDLLQASASGSASSPSTMLLTGVQATAASGQNLLATTAASYLNVTASGSTLKGNVTSDADGTGSIINMALQSSKLTGAVDPVAMTVDSASEWDITGNSIVSSLSNAGTVKFVDPTSTPPALTLTVQGPLSSSGTMTLNTQLGTDGSPSDVIILNGATATTSGSVALTIVNAGGTGALTTGNGILVVSSTNGAGPGTFTLAAPVTVVNGATVYTYTLKQVGNNWYLQSTSKTLDAQTIAFPAQPAETFTQGGTFSLNPAATASSGLPVTYASTTPTVCTVSSSGVVTMLSTGTCTITASQAGNGSYSAAAPVSQSITIRSASDASATSVPTLNEWGLMLLSSLLGLFGLTRMRKRQR